MKKKQDKPVTIEKMGELLLKHFTPVYDELKIAKKERAEIRNELRETRVKLENRVDGLRGRVDELHDRVDTVEIIQLRMENKLIDDNKLLHDRDDIHDKKLKEHEKRISKLEDTI
ncbi:MAG: hypothetical protein HYW47_07020 [Deltaproteobacteria bacterium]|nr:hypothetical protein [Deltaproteobacteria bacterium]